MSSVEKKGQDSPETVFWNGVQRRGVEYSNVRGIEAIFRSDIDGRKEDDFVFGENNMQFLENMQRSGLNTALGKLNVEHYFSVAALEVGVRRRSVDSAFEAFSKLPEDLRLAVVDYVNREVGPEKMEKGPAESTNTPEPEKSNEANVEKTGWKEGREVVDNNELSVGKPEEKVAPSPHENPSGSGLAGETPEKSGFVKLEDIFRKAIEIKASDWVSERGAVAISASEFKGKEFDDAEFRKFTEKFLDDGGKSDRGKASFEDYVSNTAFEVGINGRYLDSAVEAFSKLPEGCKEDIVNYVSKDSTVLFQTAVEKIADVSTLRDAKDRGSDWEPNASIMKFNNQDLNADMLKAGKDVEQRKEAMAVYIKHFGVDVGVSGCSLKSAAGVFSGLPQDLKVEVTDFLRDELLKPGSKYFEAHSEPARSPVGGGVDLADPFPQRSDKNYTLENILTAEMPGDDPYEVPGSLRVLADVRGAPVGEALKKDMAASAAVEAGLGERWRNKIATDIAVMGYLSEKNMTSHDRAGKDGFSVEDVPGVSGENPTCTCQVFGAGGSVAVMEQRPEKNGDIDFKGKPEYFLIKTTPDASGKAENSYVKKLEDRSCDVKLPVFENGELKMDKDDKVVLEGKLKDGRQVRVTIEVESGIEKFAKPEDAVKRAKEVLANDLYKSVAMGRHPELLQARENVSKAGKTVDDNKDNNMSLTD